MFFIDNTISTARPIGTADFDTPGGEINSILGLIEEWDHRPNEDDGLVAM